MKFRFGMIMSKASRHQTQSGAGALKWIVAVALVALAGWAAFLMAAQQMMRAELQESRAQAEKSTQEKAALEEKIAQNAKPAEDPNALELVKLRAEVARLRKVEKEHQQTLTEVQQLRATVQQLQQTSTEAAALRTQNQQLQGVVQANAAAATCQNQLKLLAGAKAQWAAQNQKNPWDVPTDADLFPRYLAQKPACPSGGVYNLGPVQARPTCNVQGHNF